VRPGSNGNAIARTLTGLAPLRGASTEKSPASGISSGTVGSGATSWSGLPQTTRSTQNTLQPGRTPVGGQLRHIAVRPCTGGEYSLGAEVFAPATLGSSKADYDGAYYWQNTGQRAATRGGSFFNGASCSLVALLLVDALSYTITYLGFRGVC